MPLTIKFDTHEKFASAIKAVKESSDEQVLIERALGRALLDALAGKKTDLTTAYASLGGKDPAVQEVFHDMNHQFGKLNLTSASSAARTAANKPAVAASKSSTIKANNPVFTVENTALHTLAALGGEEFAKNYNLK